MTHEEFKAWRNALGINQQEAADLLQISKSSIVNYEAGKRREDGRPIEIPHAIWLASLAVIMDRPGLPTDDEAIVLRRHLNDVSMQNIMRRVKAVSKKPAG